MDLGHKLWPITNSPAQPTRARVLQALSLNPGRDLEASRFRDPYNLNRQSWVLFVGQQRCTAWKCPAEPIPLFGVAVAGLGLVLCFVAWAQESEAAPCSWSTIKSHPISSKSSVIISASHEYRRSLTRLVVKLYEILTANGVLIFCITLFHFRLHTLFLGLSCRPFCTIRPFI